MERLLFYRVISGVSEHWTPVSTRAACPWRVLLASILGLTGFSASGAGATTSTPTTLPGPAPNQSQINAAQSQVSAIEATLSQEEQQTSALDNRYDTAVQNLQTAQNALQTIDASIDRTKAAVKVDRQRVTNDAVKAYIYGTPQSNYASMFSTSATLGDARTQYTKQIVGDLNQAQDALQTSESRLVSQKTQEQNLATQASAQAAQAKTLAQANQQEAVATTATLNQVQGQLTAEVAQAAVEEAQQEAAAAARAATAGKRKGKRRRRKLRLRLPRPSVGARAGRPRPRRPMQPAARPATRTREPSEAPGRVQRHRWRWSPPRSPSWASPMSSAGPARQRASTARAWCNGRGAQAGVTIPRTTEVQWPALTHVAPTRSNRVTSSSITTWTRTVQVDHVVMYVGSGPYGTDTVIQAPFTGATVSYSPIFTDGLIGAGRP